MNQATLADAVNNARAYVKGHTVNLTIDTATEEEIALWAVEKVAEIIARDMHAANSRFDRQRFLSAVGL